MRQMIGTVLLLALAGCASSGAVAAATPDEAAKAEAMFERFKALEGRWVQMQAEDAVAAPGTVVSYEVTAAGSAVIETEFEGQDHEMVTVYTLDNGRLRLTHYCAMNNQPVMYADPITSDDRVTFEAVSVGNTETPDEPHMHWADIRFVGPDRVDADWTIRKEDGTRGFVGRMNLVRAE